MKVLTFFSCTVDKVHVKKAAVKKSTANTNTIRVYFVKIKTWVYLKFFQTVGRKCLKLYEFDN